MTTQTILPDHTVRVDDKWGCFAQEVSCDIPYKKRLYEEKKIDEGDPRIYGKGWQLREMSFKSNIHGDIVEVRKELETFVANKFVKFSSLYIGTFTALIEYKFSFEDGTPAYTMVEFTVKEVNTAVDKIVIEAPKESAVKTSTPTGSSRTN